MIIKTSGTQKESVIVNSSAVQKSMPAMLHYNVDYDSLRPEDTIRSFVSRIKEMTARYAANQARIKEIESELCDLEHYIEIASYQRVPDGYRLYRKVAELRRERRACKNENDLLQPVYEYFHATEVLPRLTAVQGACAKAHAAIDMRVFTVRTAVLSEYLATANKKEETK